MSPNNDNSEHRESKQSAYNDAIKLLSRRNYSHFKLSEKLLIKGHSKEDIDEAIAELIETRLFNEVHYIESKVKGLMYKNWSPALIQQRLKREHISIPTEEIEVIFEEYGYSKEQQIRSIIDKKLLQLTNYRLPKDLEQLYWKLKEKLVITISAKGHNHYEFDQIINHRLREHIDKKP